MLQRRRLVLRAEPFQVGAIRCHCRQARGIAALRVERPPLAEQHRHRPAVDQDVMQHHHDVRAFGCQSEQGDAHQRPVPQLEARAYLGDVGLHLVGLRRRVERSEIDLLPRDGDRAWNHLQRPADALVPEARTQIGMARQQCRERSAQPRRIDRAGQIQPQAHRVDLRDGGVVERVEQQAFLERRERPHLFEIWMSGFEPGQIVRGHRDKRDIARCPPSRAGGRRVAHELRAARRTSRSASAAMLRLVDERRRPRPVRAQLRPAGTVDRLRVELDRVRERRLRCRAAAPAAAIITDRRPGFLACGRQSSEIVEAERCRIGSAPARPPSIDSDSAAGHSRGPRSGTARSCSLIVRNAAPGSPRVPPVAAAPASSRTGASVVHQPTVRETSLASGNASRPWRSISTRSAASAPAGRPRATAIARAASSTSVIWPWSASGAAGQQRVVSSMSSARVSRRAVASVSRAASRRPRDQPAHLQQRLNTVFQYGSSASRSGVARGGGECARPAPVRGPFGGHAGALAARYGRPCHPQIGQQHAPRARHPPRDDARG